MCMTGCVALASLLVHTHLPHRVDLTLERAELGQRDPLLMRIDMAFGWLRPSHYGYNFDTGTGGVGVQVRGPGEDEYRYVHTFGAGGSCVGYPRVRPMVTPGTHEALHHWVLSHDKTFYAFDKPGDYLVRAWVGLTDVRGEDYVVFSPPQMVRVTVAKEGALHAADEVWTTLYRYLEWDIHLPADGAFKLGAAVPRLGDSVTASAARRLLALHELRAATTGKDFALALAQVDELREKLPPVGREHLDVATAEIALDRGEPAAALVRLKRVPNGPRQQRLMDEYKKLTTAR